MKTVFFDLDGTLTDPKQGITRSIQYALELLDQDVPSAEALTWCIGPPLIDSLRRLTDARVAPQALALYRERFSEVGLFENQLYAGIPEVLAQLVETGYRLHVASSKPKVFVDRIVRHFELRGYFDQIFGAGLDGQRGDKAELLGYALKQTQAQPEFTWMVGDRCFDIVGARENHLDSIGVTWGYGTLAELQEAGANQIVAQPQDLLACLSSDL